jgi:hypothetical protein
VLRFEPLHAGEIAGRYTGPVQKQRLTAERGKTAPQVKHTPGDSREPFEDDRIVVHPEHVAGRANAMFHFVGR